MFMSGKCLVCVARSCVRPARVSHTACSTEYLLSHGARMHASHMHGTRARLAGTQRATTDDSITQDPAPGADNAGDVPVTAHPTPHPGPVSLHTRRQSAEVTE